MHFSCNPSVIKIILVELIQVRLDLQTRALVLHLFGHFRLFEEMCTRVIGFRTLLLKDLLDFQRRDIYHFCFLLI